MLRGAYRIFEAENGQEALAVMEREYQQLSAVLLDLGMPVMDGYEVLAVMRQSEKLSQLPVVVTTGQTDAGSEEKALRLGAKDYISKPYKSAIIKQRIANTIDLRETAATVNALQRDRLTGLFSRDAFFEKVQEMVREREPGYYIMACFDVDKFKIINDQYGTEKGDEVLRHIARVFREGFDPIGGICSRVSSDDFAVLYPSDFQDTDEIANIRRKAACVDWLATPLVFSIGRYIVGETSLSPSAMYDRAMLAADSVKGRYDEKVAEYDESMRDLLLDEQQIVTEMESALAEKQFEVWYQPQYNHATGALIGSEALVRWQHPVRGLLSPGVFVPVFEQNGFIYALDKYVWERVCQYLKCERDADRAPLPVSVNISRYDVFREDLIAVITGLIEKYDIPASLLRLEITESAFTDSMERIVSVVRRLTDLGFTLEIDDFGSGYSSLNTLKNVPAQVVKLDMRFLEDDSGSTRGGNILESIVRMTKWLGMSVIAEGVETKVQADFLRSIGCSYVQGYLYARPMPENDYRALCGKAGREEKLLVLDAVENLDNNAFWSPASMDSLIFNSYVGASCVFEYYDGKLEMLRASEKYTQLFGVTGLTIEDALRLDWMSLLSEDSLQRIVADLDESIRSREEITGEYLFYDLPKCPHETFLRVTMRVIASVGERYLVYSTNENITAQRKAEQRERASAERLQTVMDSVSCGISAVTFHGKTAEYLLANNRFYELLGYTQQQYSDRIKDDAFSILCPEDVEYVADATRQVAATGTPASIEYRALRGDGRRIWLRSLLSMAAFEGVGDNVQVCTYTDITEQKRTEQAYRNTSEQLSAMMNDMPGGFIRMHIDPQDTPRPTYVNSGFLRLVNMRREERAALIAENPFAGIHPDDAALAKEHLDRLRQGSASGTIRCRLLTGNGDYISLFVSGRATVDDAGETFLNLYYTDATEQVRDEQRQKDILDNLPYGVALYELDGDTLHSVHLNKRYWELVNRASTEYFGTGFISAIYPDDRAIVKHELAAALREKRDLICDLRVLYGKDEYRPFRVVGRILPKEDGKYAIYAVYTPISDEAMSVQEMLPVALSAMMENQSGYTFAKDKNLRYVCSSSSMAEIIGLPSSMDMTGKTDIELVGEELGKRFNAEDRHILETGEALVEHVDRLPMADGSVRYANTSKFPLKDTKGNIIGIYGFGTDVTESQAMHSQFDLLSESIPGGFISYEYRNGAFHIVNFSDRVSSLFHLSREEYLARCKENVFAGVLSEDLPALTAQLVTFVHGGAAIDCVFRVRLANDSRKWINLKTSAADYNGDAVTFNALLFDVTQRESAAERLRISEEENRLAMQHTNNVICRYDVATNTLRLPGGAQTRFNLPAVLPDVPEGPIARGNISADTANAYRNFFTSIRSGSASGDAIYQRKSDRGWRWLEARYSTIFSDAGEPVSAVISFSDVTEQLERASAYKRWRQSFQSKAPETFSLFRCNVSDRSYFAASEGSLLSIQFAPGEFDFDARTEEYVNACVFVEDRERFSGFLNADALLAGYYQGKRMISMEYRENTKDGDVRWIRLSVDLVEHEHASEIEAYILFEDIDTVKRLELITLEHAETDPLTGVLNRGAFIAQANNRIAMSGMGTQHALMMLDIDGFKQINDIFGHSIGDQTLIEIADSIRSVLRRNDLVGRFGGDEFMIFLTDIPSNVVASAKARQICALTRKSFSEEVEISGSLGIAIAPYDGLDVDTLYKKTDAALYHVKASGKDNYAFFQNDMLGEHEALPATPDEPDETNELPRDKKRRMLIVDDSRIDHAMLSNIFIDTFHLEKARDGNTALVRLRHYGTSISVVLLDLMMPGINGFSVLRRIQETPELRTIPVIVVTGDNNPLTSLRAIREGAADYIMKPVDPDLLRVRVETVISRAENERLRAKNSFLEYESNEITRYRVALERTGTLVIEHDWIAGTFVYDPDMSKRIAGNFDKRALWHILLSDLVAETQTVQQMQGLVHEIAADKGKSEADMLVRLKTPEKTWHWFKFSVYKGSHAFGLTGRVYLSFLDIGAERPGNE